MKRLTKEELELEYKKYYLELDIFEFKPMWKELRDEILNLWNIYSDHAPESPDGHEKELYILNSVIRSMDISVSVKVTEKRIKNKVCQFCSSENLDPRGFGTTCSKCFEDHEEILRGERT